MERVYEFLKEAETYYLATVEGDRTEARQAMLDAYPSLQGMYKADDGNTQVLYFTDATATISAFTHEPEVIIL